jgi:hypothetical protein
VTYSILGISESRQKMQDSPKPENFNEKPELQLYHSLTDLEFLKIRDKIRVAVKATRVGMISDTKRLIN